MSGVHIVWFRQDLRVHDNAALKAACVSAARDDAQIVPLYIAENDRADAVSERFLAEALNDLEHALDQRGAALHFRRGDALDVLTDLHAQHRVLSVHAHEILSDEDSRLQDRRVEAWSMRAGVPFQCHQQYGPDLSDASHNGWRPLWDAFVASPRHEAPDCLIATNIGVGSKPWSSASEEAAQDRKSGAKGGRKDAIKYLREILKYASNLDQIGREGPHEAAAQFRRLEPYLELGSISIREVWQAAMSAHHQYIAAGHDIRAARVTALIKHLPGLFLRRFGMGHASIHRPSSARTCPSNRQDEQLSLDLF